MPEGEEGDQEIENLFEQIIKENFPNLAKETDFREVWEAQEAQTVPKKLDRKGNTPRHMIIKLPKIKDKDRIKRKKQEEDSYLQRSFHKAIS